MSTETIVQQRHKERKALKLFLLTSLVGSLAFHAGVMALKVGDRADNLSIDPTEEEMEVVIEEASPEQPIQEQVDALEPPSESDVPDVPEEVAFAPEVASLQPLAPDSPTPLEKGEDAPSDQPVTAPEAAQPMTNSTGDTSLKVGGGPLFKPFGLGSGFGNAERPTGFNPLGIPTGDPNGKPSGVPNGNPNGKPGGDPNGKPGGVPNNTAIRTAPAAKPKTPVCVSCPKPKFQGQEASPRVEMKIQPDGSVQVRLRKSSGNPDLDRQTLETMSKWRFDPQSIPEGGVKKRVRVTYEEEGSTTQRQNEQRRRREAERQQIAEQERQRQEAQERQRQPPATAVEAPEKPASLPTAPSTAKPVADPAPAPAAETLPPPVEVAPPAEPAPEPIPEPAPEPALEPAPEPEPEPAPAEASPSQPN